VEDVDPRFSTQTKARKAALDILFQADMRGQDFADALLEQQGYADQTFRALTIDIVQGIAEHERAIDQRIAECADSRWTLERMPRVDRNLARIGIFEIDYRDTPDSVVISEIMELASWLSTDESPAFLNGLLARAVRRKPTAS
jgi:transcription antitermination protein NusB